MNRRMSLLWPCIIAIAALNILLVFSEERRRLSFDAKAIFGNDHEFAKGTNDIRTIEVLESKPAPEYPRLPEFRSTNPFEADVSIIRKHYENGLSSVRNHKKQILKDKTMDYLVSVLVRILGNDSVSLTPFRVSGEEYIPQFLSVDYPTFNGTNIVGVLKGPKFEQNNDPVFVIGAHWDTTADCPGVDDNGSGVNAVLELARLLQRKKASIPFTVYFVLFDFEEYGLLGSYVFTATQMAPRVAKGLINVIGMYNFDMILNYNATRNSQLLSHTIMIALFTIKDESLINANSDFTQEIANNGYKGDFIAVLSRKDHDKRLSKAISQAFNSFNPTIKTKLYNFEAPLSKIASQVTNDQRGNFTLFFRSDHMHFWYPNYENTIDSIWNPPENEYNITIDAVTFSDTANLRGIQRHCYHKPCDNADQLTADNLNFLMTVIKTADISIDLLAEEYAKAPFLASQQGSYNRILVATLLVILIAFLFCSIIYFYYLYRKNLSNNKGQ